MGDKRQHPAPSKKKGAASHKRPLFNSQFWLLCGSYALSLAGRWCRREVGGLFRRRLRTSAERRGDPAANTLGGEFQPGLPVQIASRAFSIRRLPNPRRVGGTTGGPPLSRQLRWSRSSFAVQRSSTRPSGRESAPYFAALVASSCSASESASAWFGETSSAGPSRTIWPVTKGAMARATRSATSAPAQLRSVSKSCARARATIRAFTAVRANSISVRAAQTSE